MVHSLVALDRHINTQWTKAFARGQDFPVAIAIGQDPTVIISAVANCTLGQDELDLAGALRGAPVELVKCKTVPLEVPATSEWVLEGWMRRGSTKQEGPFGEAYGYYGESLVREVIEISAITHRNSPIHQACYSYRSPNEQSSLRLRAESELLVQYPSGGLVKVNIIDTMAIASIRKRADGQSKIAAMGLLAAPEARPIKIVIMVDEDINPHNLHEVMWAVSSRCQPERGVEIIKDVSGSGIDPSLPEESKLTRTSLTSKMIIDATRPISKPFAEAVAPQREAMERVEKDWEKYGIF
jgi:2,5-furandicarboxylate decarboxylase 1